MATTDIDIEDNKETCEDCGRAFDVRFSGYEDASKCGPCWDRINNVEASA